VNEKIQTNSPNDLHLFHSKQIAKLKSLFKAQFLSLGRNSRGAEGAENDSASIALEKL
jgi:hypothetical protein